MGEEEALGLFLCLELSSACRGAGGEAGAFCVQELLVSEVLRRCQGRRTSTSQSEPAASDSPWDLSGGLPWFLCVDKEEDDVLQSRASLCTVRWPV